VNADHCARWRAFAGLPDSANKRIKLNSVGCYTIAENGWTGCRVYSPVLERGRFWLRCSAIPATAKSSSEQFLDARASATRADAADAFAWSQRPSPTPFGSKHWSLHPKPSIPPHGSLRRWFTILTKALSRSVVLGQWRDGADKVLMAFGARKSRASRIVGARG
jgi:hypothetical protein